MARTDPQINIRMPAELIERLEKSALDNHRAFKSEIIARLHSSYEDIEGYQELSELFIETLKENAENSRREVEEYRQMIATIRLMRHTVERLLDHIGRDELPSELRTLVSILVPKSAPADPDEAYELMSELIAAMENHEKIVAEHEASGVGVHGRDRIEMIRQRLLALDQKLNDLPVKE